VIPLLDHQGGGLSYAPLVTTKLNHKRSNTSGHSRAQVVKIKTSHGLLSKATPLLMTINRLSLTRESKEQSLAVDALKSVMRGMFSGDRVYTFYLGSTERYVTASSTLGVVNFLRAMYTDLVTSSNWSALASIFDEFTVRRAEYSFVPLSSGFNVTAPGPSYIAFDDDGGPGAPTSASAVTAYPTCKMVCPAIQGSALATEANSTGFSPIRFPHIRPYPVDRDGPAVLATSTGWVSTSTPSNLLGDLLVYNSSCTSSSNAAVYSYMVQFEVLLRCVY
jgi:hypothetical protein